MIEIDSIAGWRYRAGHKDRNNSISPQGLRSLRLYTERPTAGVTRIAAFGDSFVYGNDVPDSAAWCAQLERLNPGNLEVANYGVGGYGVDQAYLRYQTEGAALHPQIVFIGFATDDLRRVVNVYRRFISSRELPLLKPRFVLDSANRLKLLPVPARGAQDYKRYLQSPRDILEIGPAD